MSAPERVLVVEDDASVRRALARALEGAGYEVTVAGSRDEAALLADTFAVAVLDIELGDGSGLDLAGELLADGRARSVVFHSATRDRGEQERASDLGKLVEKTGDTSELLEEVARLLAP